MGREEYGIKKCGLLLPHRKREKYVSVAAFENAYNEELEELKQKTKEDSEVAALTLGTMLVLAVATSIDALSIGVLFIPIPEVLWLAIGIIAATSFAFSLVGFELGKRLGKHLPVNANIVGGCILIAIGVKIFLEGILA